MACRHSWEEEQINSFETIYDKHAPSTKLTEPFASSRRIHRRWWNFDGALKNNCTSAWAEHILGKLAASWCEPGGTFSDNSIGHSLIRHVFYLHVCVHGCACYTKIWTDSTYLGSILTNECKSCMQKSQIKQRILLKTHNSTFYVAISTSIYPCT